MDIRRGGESLHFHSLIPAGSLNNLYKKGSSMTKNEAEVIEKLADDAEIVINDDYTKKDMKEKRAVVKNTLYDGSKKLKHRIPKGKRV